MSDFNFETSSTYGIISVIFKGVMYMSEKTTRVQIPEGEVTEFASSAPDASHTIKAFEGGPVNATGVDVVGDITVVYAGKNVRYKIPTSKAGEITKKIRNG